MSMRAPKLSGQSYRWLDRLSKLVGVVLIAGGLEIGGDTVTGIALAVVGVAIGLITVFITEQ